MPKDDINYRFTENGIVYDFYDVFVPAENFRQPSLFTWGRNIFGHLGDNSTTGRVTPVTTFAGGTTWKSVAGGWNHTAAIKTDGSLWVWGYGEFGQLGNNVQANRSTPVTTFAGGNNWKSVAGGWGTTAAIKTDGTLWLWGENGGGKLGDNTTTTRNVPVTTFAGGNNWKSVSMGFHTAAIKTDGSLWVWGGGVELGTNDGSSPRTPVTTFAGGTNWKQVSCGSQYTAAIKTDGSLWTWGVNGYGQLGTNDTTTRSTPVTTFAGGNTWKSVAAGHNSLAAIKTDGSLWTWGRNNSGQLGTDGGGNRSTPVTTFAGGNNWKSASSGLAHVAAIKTDGTLWVWGTNSSGNLGTNDTTQRNVPVNTILGGNNWKSVATGELHTLAIQYQPDP